MRENDLALRVEPVNPLVDHQHRNEVDKLDDCLLVKVDLSTLDLDQLVRHVLVDMEHDLVFEHVTNHLVVLGL